MQETCGPHAEKLHWRNGGKNLLVVLLCDLCFDEYWFVFLDCSQRDSGQRTNDSLFSYFTQTYIPTSNKLEMKPGRVSEASHTQTGCHCVTQDHGERYLRNVWGQGPCLSPNAGHR